MKLINDISRVLLIGTGHFEISSPLWSPKSSTKFIMDIKSLNKSRRYLFSKNIYDWHLQIVNDFRNEWFLTRKKNHLLTNGTFSPLQLSSLFEEHSREQMKMTFFVSYSKLRRNLFKKYSGFFFYHGKFCQKYSSTGSTVLVFNVG